MRRIALIISLAVAGALQAQVDEEWPGIDETPALQSFLTGLMEDDPETYDTLTEACEGDVSKAFVQVRDVVGDSGESAEAQRQILQEAAVYLRHRAGNGGDMADTTAASSTTTWDHLYNSIIDELDDLNDVDLESRLREAKEELFNLRFQAATGQLESHGRLRTVKKDIARIYTVVRERELGIRTAPGTSSEDEK